MGYKLPPYFGSFGEAVTDIGASPQLNTPRDSWAEFFRDCRLEPQLRAAAHYFDKADEKRIVRLTELFGASYLSVVRRVLEVYS